MNNIIDVQHVSKSYGTLKAVDDLSFNVKQGEIFAMLGPNGSGKSTTIRMVLDILKPDSGSISVLGGKVTGDTLKRIGYLPEERGLYKNVKIVDQMVYLAQLKGTDASVARKRAAELLERLDLAEHLESKITELSKGMSQKVQFAVTLLHQPALIIIDEVFSGLDPVNRMAIKELLSDFRDEGGTIIMSTHQMNEVQEMADRMLMISRGKLALYGPIEKIREDYSDHAILVDGEGDWQALNGVESVEAAPDDRSAVLLRLHESVTMDEILAEIAQSHRFTIKRFERAIPSLNQIFIRVAGETNHA